MLSKRELEMEKEAILNVLYDVVLDSDTFEYERNIFIHHKNDIESGAYIYACLNQLVTELTPYAVKSKLSPKVAKLYRASNPVPGFGTRLGPGLILMSGVWNGGN